MVIDDLNVKCIAAFKTEAHAPLVIDADAPLPRARSCASASSLFDGGRRKSSICVAASNCVKRIAVRFRISGGNRRDLPVA